MKRFARQNELDFLLEQNRLTTQQIEQFADYLAQQHRQAPTVAATSLFGSLETIKAPAVENFSQVRQLLSDSNTLHEIRDLESWCGNRLAELQPLFEQRKANGFIRECHGDVHLANMVWLEGQPVLFDCIEFNDSFRCIDVVNDYAFLLMDLDDRNAKHLSWSFLNRYLRQTGDYGGLPLVNFYKCYRSMVRAKVLGLRLQQTGLSSEEKNYDTALFRSYLDLASRYSHRSPTPLIVTHGYSGAGKSTFAKQLAADLGAVTIHSDIERKRLHGLSATAQTGSDINAGIYQEELTTQTYARLLSLAKQVITAGFLVIVDATFLNRQYRASMHRLAQELRVPFVILDFQIAEDELFQRIRMRRNDNEIISEAGEEVLKQQLATAQPLSPRERDSVIAIVSNSSSAEIAQNLTAGWPQVCAKF